MNTNPQPHPEQSPSPQGPATAAEPPAVEETAALPVSQRNRYLFWALFSLLLGMGWFVMAVLGGIVRLMFSPLQGGNTLPASGLAVVALVMIAGGGAAWWRLQRPAARLLAPPFPLVWRRVSAGLLWLALLIGVGVALSQTLHPILWVWLILPIHAWVLLLLSFVAVGVVLGTVEVTERVPPLRRWVALQGGALAIVPVLVAEGLALLGAGALLWLAFSERLRALMPLLRAPQLPLLMRHIRPLFNEPLVLWLVLLYVALVVPLIEEACKPLAVWYFVRRGLTPRGGLVLGALAGAGFALVENSGLPWGQEMWTSQILVRSLTTVLHTALSALMGYALAEATRTRRWPRLGMAYAAAVLLHGLWNAVPVLYGLREVGVALPAGLEVLRMTLPLGVGLAVLGLLWQIRRTVRALEAQPAPPFSPASSPTGEAAPSKEGAGVDVL